MPIYAIVPHNGKQYLAVGGVYSHYEFRQPIADRLTDEQWRERVGTGRVPPMAGWASSFAARLDAAPLIELLKQGELPRDAIWVDDPAVEAFLETAIAPGGLFEGKWNLPRAIELYAKKAGRKAAPKLLFYFTHPTGPAKLRIKYPGLDETTEEFPLGDQRAHGAWKALQGVAGPEHIPELEKLARGDHEWRAGAALGIIGSVNDKAAERCIVGLLTDRGPEAIRRGVIWMLGERGSRDVTPALLKAYRTASTADDREDILRGLGWIWCEGLPPHMPRPRWPSDLEEPAAAELRKEVVALILSVLADPSSSLFREAADAAGLMKLREAIPLIERACARTQYFEHALALGDISGDEAVHALLRLTQLANWASEDRTDSVSLLRALEKLKTPLTVAPMLGILETKGVSTAAQGHAARVLLAIYPDGPKWPWEGSQAERAEVIAAWRKHVREQGRRNR